MANPAGPFDNIESAHEYVRLLGEAIDEALRDAAADADAAVDARHLDAVRLVIYKLDQLRTHMTAGSRLLNDLRTLRRLLLDERAEDDEDGEARLGVGDQESVPVR